MRKEYSYNPEDGEFIDFATLNDWQSRDKDKEAFIATLKTELAEAREALELPIFDSWSDREDYITEHIKKDYHTADFVQRYVKALELVGNRHSKGSLVALVAYLMRQDSIMAVE